MATSFITAAVAFRSFACYTCRRFEAFYSEELLVVDP
jgi:hypothetical protein